MNITNVIIKIFIPINTQIDATHMRITRIFSNTLSWSYAFTLFTGVLAYTSNGATSSRPTKEELSEDSRETQEKLRELSEKVEELKAKEREYEEELKRLGEKEKNILREASKRRI